MSPHQVEASDPAFKHAGFIRFREYTTTSGIRGLTFVYQKSISLSGHTKLTPLQEREEFRNIFIIY